MKQWAYLSPSRVSCSTCGAQPDEMCMRWEPYSRTWIENSHYHVEREAKYRDAQLPLQLTLPMVEL